METTLAKIDPKEYGLEETQVATIEQAFAPKIAERDGLVTIYQQVIIKELTPELCKQAKEIRLKLVKVRTGIADIHKTQKAFFLAAGRFVDAWKNKETAPVEQMEENLEKIENHFINIEKERIAKLESERTAALKQYTDIVPQGLGSMQNDVFEAYLASQKKMYEDRLAAEKKAEEDRLAAIEAEKKEQERIRIENEKLKKEAEERERIAEIERKKQAEKFAKLEAERKALEEKARKEREIAEAAARKAQQEANSKLEAERKERERIENELKLKKEAEEKKEIERLIAEKKAASAPDKNKLIALASQFENIAMPELKTPEAINILTNIAELQGNLVNYIIQKSNSL